MDQAGQDKPARMAIVPDLLCCLEQVLKLREVGIRIAVVNERVEEFHRFPNAHAAAGEGEEIFLFGLNEVVGLMAMIEPVELADGWSGVGLVIPELFRLFFRIDGLKWFGVVAVGCGLGISSFEEVLPFLEVAQGSFGFR